MYLYKTELNLNASRFKNTFRDKILNAFLQLNNDKSKVPCICTNYNLKLQGSLTLIKEGSHEMYSLLYVHNSGVSNQCAFQDLQLV